MDSQHHELRSSAVVGIFPLKKKLGKSKNKEEKKKMRIIPLELWSSGTKSPFEKEEDDHDNFRRSWARLFFPKLHRKCMCTGCNEDKKVQEFFTRKRYWWTSRTL